MKISQREARRLKRRVEILEGIIKRQRNNWSEDYPGGTHLGKLTRERDWLSGRIESARMLGHAIVVTEHKDGVINFYALRLPEESTA